MRYNEFRAAYLKLLNEHTAARTENLTSGSCESFSKYTKLCGALEGLALAERLFEELYQDKLKREE